MNQKSTPKPKKVIPAYRIFSKTGIFQDYKACPRCGQNELPFKKGICPKCSYQIGDIRYVKDPKEYVKSNYGDVKMNGIREMNKESGEQ